MSGPESGEFCGKGMVRCPFWLKALSGFEPSLFSPSHPPCMALNAVFSSPPLLSQLAGFLGLDHRSRSALEASCRFPVWEFRRWPVSVVARRGFYHSVPYACLRARAAYRVRAFFASRLAALGRLVLLGRRPSPSRFRPWPFWPAWPSPRRLRRLLGGLGAPGSLTVRG